MPIHKVTITDTFIEVCKASNNCRRINYADLTGPSSKKEQDMMDEFQDYFDFKQARSSLPDDDLDKTIDPERRDLFWDGSNLVGRAIEVLKVKWDEDEEKVSEFEIERTT